MTTAYIGLGSNMDMPELHIKSAIQSLGEIKSSKLRKVSSLYKSKPVGPQDQDDYINAVAELETELEAIELLGYLQAIEDEHGRARTQHWGPRTLDLDILMYGDDKIQNKRLTVPHKEMLNRSFVLIPLAEINPECNIPGAGLIQDCIDNIDRDDLVLLS